MNGARTPKRGEKTAVINGTYGDDDPSEGQFFDLVGDGIINALAGDDFIRMEVGGTDTVNGGDGDDAVSYEAQVAGMTIDVMPGFATDASGTKDTLNGILSVFGSHCGVLLRSAPPPATPMHAPATTRPARARTAHMSPPAAATTPSSAARAATA